MISVQSSYLLHNTGLDACSANNFESCNYVTVKDIVDGTSEVDCSEDWETSEGLGFLKKIFATCEGEPDCADHCDLEECLTDSDCHGEPCDDEGNVVVWSYNLPNESNAYNQGIKPKAISCCQSDSCAYGDNKCQIYNTLNSNQSYLCIENNNWLVCNLQTPELIGTKSLSGNFYCTGTEWIPVEANCSDGEDDGGYPDSTDCADPTCDERVGAVYGQDGCLKPEGCLCQYNEELTCDDGFNNDNDGNMIIDVCAQQDFPQVCNSPLCVGGQYLSLCGSYFAALEAVSNPCTPGTKKIIINPGVDQVIVCVPQICQTTDDCEAGRTCKLVQNQSLCVLNEEPGEGKTTETITDEFLIKYEEINDIDDSGYLLHTDCIDSDCVDANATGPNKAQCCSTDSDCSAGAVCGEDNECHETICDKAVDNDKDNLTQCEDPDCNLKQCDDMMICSGNVCTGIKGPGQAALQEKIFVQIFSYKQLLEELNKCQLKTGTGVCNTICGTQKCIFADGGRNSCSEEGSTKCTCC